MHRRGKLSTAHPGDYLEKVASDPGLRGRPVELPEDAIPVPPTDLLHRSRRVCVCPELRENRGQGNDLALIREILHAIDPKTHEKLRRFKELTRPGMSGDMIPWKDLSHGTSQ